jgi:hypothetical protein
MAIKANIMFKMGVLFVKLMQFFTQKKSTGYLFEFCNSHL